jgi:hypothetical protein
MLHGLGMGIFAVAMFAFALAVLLVGGPFLARDFFLHAVARSSAAHISRVIPLHAGLIAISPG